MNNCSTLVLLVLLAPVCGQTLPDSHAVRVTPGGHEASNPGQGWRTRFDGRSAITKPVSGNWAWGLELASYGFEGQEIRIENPTQSIVRGNRLTYRFDSSIDEWYVNDRRGLEHGFTLRQRPRRGTDASQSPLTLSLRVRGSLQPHVAEDGRGVLFEHAGQVVLTYTGLVAFDADGKRLPATIHQSGKHLRIRVEERGARYPLTVDPLAQQAYLKASNTDAYDRFGRAVAVSGTTLVIGAPYEGSKATGVNGDQSDNSMKSAGAAYVFIRGTAGYHQQAYLKASDTRAGMRYGYAVAIDGNTIAVGSTGEAVYIYVRTGTTWTQQARLRGKHTEVGDYFGLSVSLEGDVLIVGAALEDGASTDVNGDQRSNTSKDSGAAYIFVRSGSTWSQKAYLKASNTGPGDYFGTTLDVSGNIVVVGARMEDSPGSSMACHPSCAADNSRTNAGAAYVFVKSMGIWRPDVMLKSPDPRNGDMFGYAVGVSGSTIAVGAPRARGAGMVFISQLSAGKWLRQQSLVERVSGGIAFGASLAIDGDSLVIGAPSENSAATGVNNGPNYNGAIDSGAGYMFERSGTTWSRVAYIKASNTDMFDSFGAAVAMSGDTIIVGASWESSAARGVNGNQVSNAAAYSGAAYLFEKCYARCAKRTRVGQRCRTSGGHLELYTDRPILGTSIRFNLTGGGNRVSGFGLFGLPHSGIRLGLTCEIYVDIGKPTVLWAIQTDSFGQWLSAPLPVGTSNSLIGVIVGAQAGVLDPATQPLGHALTNGLHLRIGL